MLKTRMKAVRWTLWGRNAASSTEKTHWNHVLHVMKLLMLIFCTTQLRLLFFHSLNTVRRRQRMEQGQWCVHLLYHVVLSDCHNMSQMHLKLILGQIFLGTLGIFGHYFIFSVKLHWLLWDGWQQVGRLKISRLHTKTKSLNWISGILLCH